MRWCLLFLLLGAARPGSAQPGTAAVPRSENGWYLSPHGTIRVLVLFAEVVYDKNPSRDPQPVPTNDWPKGQLPAWKDDLFDPRPLAQPKAMVSRYYHDISLDDYTVLGDYVDQLITIRESEHANFGDWSGNAWVAANRQATLHTAHGSTINDLDQWHDSSNPGMPKMAGADEPHSYDHVMVILRNSSLTHGQGSTDAGSAGQLFGYPSDTQSRFGAMNGLPFEILKHEFNHLLLGGNNFHSAGGNAAQFSSYLLSLQGGWSMMGAASSSLLTACAWDRDRMGWGAKDAPYRINAHDAQGGYVNSDLDPLAGDTGIFILKDFVTQGDALRIRMPFLPEGEYRQWLWVENHQTYARNGSPTDRFHWENTNADCLSPAVPGLYMIMQIERENKSGPDLFGGYADYLHPLTACGYYDVSLTDDTVPACPFGGQDRAYRKEARWMNPLSGNCEQELPVYDRNKDGRVERSEHFVMGSGYQPGGELVTDAALFGAARHAWSANSKRVLNIGSNPSSANILTLGCNNKRELNKHAPPDNRTVYLNGIRIELQEQYANGDIAVRVCTGDTRLTEDTRWCADSIVLPPLRGRDGRSLTVSAGKRLLIDRSRTPTRMDLQETKGGFSYFAPPTSFTIASGASVLLERKSVLSLDNRSAMHLMPGAELVLDRTAKLHVASGSRIVVHRDAKVSARPKVLRKLRKRKQLIDADR
ncbi:MAG: hypothetical protein QM724_02750 [Flavobacteriales bacterium]